MLSRCRSPVEAKFHLRRLSYSVPFQNLRNINKCHFCGQKRNPRPAFFYSQKEKDLVNLPSVELDWGFFCSAICSWCPAGLCNETLCCKTSGWGPSCVSSGANTNNFTARQSSGMIAASWTSNVFSFAEISLKLAINFFAEI